MTACNGSEFARTMHQATPSAPAHARARGGWRRGRSICSQVGSEEQIDKSATETPVRKQFAKSLRTRMSCGRCNVARARVPVRSGSDIFLLSYRVGYPCDD